MVNRYLKTIIPENKIELLKLLQERTEDGDPHALALAYIIYEVCPDDRTTKRVFGILHRTKTEEKENV